MMTLIESPANVRQIRVVLDTNVLISAALLGIQARYILDLIEQGRLALFLSAAILHETDRKLRTKFRRSKEERSEFFMYLEPLYQVVQPAELAISKLRDPSDRHIIGTAVAAQANLIITTDPDLLTLKRYKTIGIVHPKTIGWLFR
ncbi:putative toxin-antitoxin system toxin component, PIN family [Candidatus Berkelbacteria bacterium]|nr:putative toxin-antitoxin system toxin component, PIN family [Candidatus Berkelbacteria bacterium]